MPSREKRSGTVGTTSLPVFIRTRGSMQRGSSSKPVSVYCSMSYRPKSRCSSHLPNSSREHRDSRRFHHKGNNPPENEAGGVLPRALAAIHQKAPRKQASENHVSEGPLFRWCGAADSNRELLPCKGSTLPVELAPPATSSPYRP